MPRYRRYRLEKLQITPMGERHASWTFTREPVSGVRVPSAGDDRIEVRPRATPSLKAWIGLERRSLTFARASRTGYRGRYYCQIALADPTGERTKDVLKKHERALLPPWFDEVSTRLRVKGTVRSTKGNDADQLVAVVRPSEHAVMIGLFFATKVWVLKEKVVLAAAS